MGSPSRFLTLIIRTSSVFPNFLNEKKEANIAPFPQPPGHGGAQLCCCARWVAISIPNVSDKHRSTSAMGGIIDGDQLENASLLSTKKRFTISSRMFIDCIVSATNSLLFPSHFGREQEAVGYRMS
jgi:hypothetical protein